MKIDIDVPLPSLANISQHWQKKRKTFNKFHRLAYWDVLPHIREILAMKMPITIKLIRLGPRELDFDNLVYAFKPVRDGVAEALWPEKSLPTQDNHEDVIWEYGQIKNKLRSIALEFYSG